MPQLIYFLEEKYKTARQSYILFGLGRCEYLVLKYVRFCLEISMEIL